MVRRSSTLKWRLERSMPYRVDLPFPPNGFGMQLNEMLDWCYAHIGPLEQGWGWGSHWDGKADHLRLYFKDQETAGRFIEIWKGDGEAPQLQRKEVRFPYSAGG